MSNLLGQDARRARARPEIVISSTTFNFFASANAAVDLVQREVAVIVAAASTPAALAAKDATHRAGWTNPTKLELPLVAFSKAKRLLTCRLSK